MPLWPLPVGPVRRAVSRSTSSIAYVNVVSSGSAHVKGNWAEVFASTPIDAKYLFLRGNGTNASGAASPFLLDVAIGASGSETIILNNLDVGFTASNATWLIPVQIPAGTRVAARMQGARTSVTFQTLWDLLGDETLAGGPPGVAQWVTYGADTANSCGTGVTSGNTNTWGSWTQIGSATSTDHDYWIARADMGAQTAVTNINYRFQMAFAPNTTAAGTCVTNGTHLELPNTGAGNTAEILYQYAFDSDPTYAPTPAGTNIYVRGAASGTAQTVYIVVYGGK